MHKYTTDSFFHTKGGQQQGKIYKHFSPLHYKFLLGMKFWSYAPLVLEQQNRQQGCSINLLQQ